MNNILWTAQRHGHDWIDADVTAAIEWFTSLVPSAEWERRIADVDVVFESAKSDWAEGRRTPLFDPKDLVAWYIHQARCYADPARRPNFFEPEGYRIAPVFRRLGQVLPSLKQITGTEERASRLMQEGRAQPDDAIYEMLIAGAYRQRAWQQVSFVPETPGLRKQPDIFVKRGRSEWAVECKRAGRSGYARDERLAGERMSEAAHEISRQAGRPLVIMAHFRAELAALGDGYLAEKATAFTGAARTSRGRTKAARELSWTFLGMRCVMSCEQMTSILVAAE